MTFNKVRYITYFLGTLLGLFIVLQLLSLIGLELQNAGLAIIPPMVASMVEGQKFAKDNQAPLNAPWTQAFGMTVIAVGLNICLSVVAIITISELQDTFNSYLGFIVATFVVFSIIWFFVNRFFYGMGARNVWKAQT